MRCVVRAVISAAIDAQPIGTHLPCSELGASEPWLATLPFVVGAVIHVPPGSTPLSPPPFPDLHNPSTIRNEGRAGSGVPVLVLNIQGWE